MNQTIPIDVAARIQTRAQARADFNERNAWVNALMNEKKIGVVHFYRDGQKGGATVAYQRGTGQQRRWMTVNVAYCSHADNFSKKQGKVNAVEGLLDGSGTEVRIPRSVGNQLTEFIRIIYDYLYAFSETHEEFTTDSSVWYTD